MRKMGPNPEIAFHCQTSDVVHTPLAGRFERMHPVYCVSSGVPVPQVLKYLSVTQSLNALAIMRAASSIAPGCFEVPSSKTS